MYSRSQCPKPLNVVPRKNGFFSLRLGGGGGGFLPAFGEGVRPTHIRDMGKHTQQRTQALLRNKTRKMFFSSVLASVAVFGTHLAVFEVP